MSKKPRARVSVNTNQREYPQNSNDLRVGHNHPLNAVLRVGSYFPPDEGEVVRIDPLHGGAYFLVSLSDQWTGNVWLNEEALLAGLKAIWKEQGKREALQDAATE